ncbi:hypothetical protein HHX47_DHR10000232 [Lentinula edodes]|nr:hypothetical protein HHX47_DHR10000232 [Lentinula edodes]
MTVELLYLIDPRTVPKRVKKNPVIDYATVRQNRVLCAYVSIGIFILHTSFNLRPPYFSVFSRSYRPISCNGCPLLTRMTTVPVEGKTESERAKSCYM